VGRRLAETFGLLVVLPAAIGGVLALLLIVLVSGIRFPSFSLTPPRPKPIAISPAACPYVQAIRSTSDSSAASMQVILLDPADLRVSPGVTEAPSAQGLAAYRRLPDQLAALDLSLRVGATKVPAPLRRKLNEVAADVEDGRVAMMRDHDPASYMNDVMSRRNSLVDGVDALAYASDLVGDQCGVVLSNYRIGF
jgi:hypothetical protein